MPLYLRGRRHHYSHTTRNGHLSRCAPRSGRHTRFAKPGPRSSAGGPLSGALVRQLTTLKHPRQRQFVEQVTKSLAGEEGVHAVGALKSLVIGGLAGQAHRQLLVA